MPGAVDASKIEPTNEDGSCKYTCLRAKVVKSAKITIEAAKAK